MRYVLALSLLVSVAAGQTRPDFAGTWKIDASQGAATGGGRGGGNGRGNSQGGGLGLGPSADTLVITRDARAVTIEERYGTVRNTVVLPLDGRKVTNRVGAGRGRGAMSAEFTSVLKDGQLVSALAVSNPEQSSPRRYEHILSIDASGALVVSIKEVGTNNSRTVVYRRP